METVTLHRVKKTSEFLLTQVMKPICFALPVPGHNEFAAIQRPQVYTCFPLRFPPHVYNPVVPRIFSPQKEFFLRENPACVYPQWLV